MQNNIDIFETHSLLPIVLPIVLPIALPIVLPIVCLLPIVVSPLGPGLRFHLVYFREHKDGGDSP